MSRPPFLSPGRVVDEGEVDGVAWCTAPGGIRPSMVGYARLPDRHPWRGLDYDEIAEVAGDDLDVHGGLTYGDGEWIGFDTAHLGDRWEIPDDLDVPDHHREILRLMFEMPYPVPIGRTWTRELVADEARSLAWQVAQVRRRRWRRELRVRLRRVWRSDLYRWWFRSLDRDYGSTWRQLRWVWLTAVLVQVPVWLFPRVVFGVPVTYGDGWIYVLARAVTLLVALVLGSGSVAVGVHFGHWLDDRRRRSETVPGPGSQEPLSGPDPPD